MGSRFVVTQESSAHIDFKNTVVGLDEEQQLSLQKN